MDSVYGNDTAGSLFVVLVILVVVLGVGAIVASLQRRTRLATGLGCLGLVALGLSLIALILSASVPGSA